MNRKVSNIISDVEEEINKVTDINYKNVSHLPSTDNKSRVAETLLTLGIAQPGDHSKVMDFYCSHLSHFFTEYEKRFKSEYLLNVNKTNTDNIDIDKLNENIDTLWIDFLVLLSKYQIVEDVVCVSLAHNKCFSKIAAKISKSTSRYIVRRSSTIAELNNKILLTIRENNDVGNNSIEEEEEIANDYLNSIDAFYQVGSGAYKLLNMLSIVAYNSSVCDFVLFILREVNRALGIKYVEPSLFEKVSLVETYDIPITNKLELLDYLKTPRTNSDVSGKIGFDGNFAARIIDVSFKNEWKVYKNTTNTGINYFIVMPKAENLSPIKRDIFISFDYETNTMNVQKEEESNSVLFSTITDMHEGLISVRPEIVDKFINIINNNNIYVVGTGDLLENANKTSVGAGWTEQNKPPYQQILDAKKKMEKITPQLLGIVGGNHSTNRMCNSGIDVEEVLAHFLGVPYSDDYMIVCFTINGISFVNYCWHGYGKSATEGGKINSALRPFIYTEGIDTYWSGHFHDFKRVCKIRYEYDKFTRTMHERTVNFVLQGGFNDFQHSFISRQSGSPSVRHFAVAEFSTPEKNIRFVEFDLLKKDYLLSDTMCLSYEDPELELKDIGGTNE
jgi:hypothetical protein